MYRLATIYFVTDRWTEDSIMPTVLQNDWLKTNPIRNL